MGMPAQIRSSDFQPGVQLFIGPKIKEIQERETYLHWLPWERCHIGSVLQRDSSKVQSCFSYSTREGRSEDYIACIQKNVWSSLHMQINWFVLVVLSLLLWCVFVWCTASARCIQWGTTTSRRFMQVSTRLSHESWEGITLGMAPAFI